MKTGHLVPLSQQAYDVLIQIKVVTGQYQLVFPSERNRFRSMSDKTMCKAIFVMGYDGNHESKAKVTPNGLCATVSSIFNEQGFNPDAIERQLSHMEGNGVRAAYTHHARYLEDRRELINGGQIILTVPLNRELRGLQNDRVGGIHKIIGQRRKGSSFR